MTTKYFNVKQGITTGNITLDAASGNITNGNWVIANYFSGNGSSLTGIAGANITGVVANANYAAYAGNVVNAAQPNITSVGTLTSLIVGNATANVTITAAGGNGTLTATANITAPYFIGNVVGNISGNIVVPGTNTSVLFNNDGNAGASSNFTFNKDTNVATINGNLITNNANLGNAATANYFIGNLWGTANNATTAGTVTTNAQPNITSVGTLTDLSVSGNAIVGGNLVINGNTTYVNIETLQVEDPIIELGGGPNGAPLTTNDGKDRGTLLHYYTTAPVDAFMGWDNSNAEFAFGSNVTVSGEIVTFASLGNVRANYFIGNGSQLTGVTATTASTANTVTDAAQPNITSVGTLSSLSVTGNVTAGNIIGVFANGTSNVAIPAVNGNVNISAAGTANVLVVTATGANIAGTLNATGNANVGNLGATSIVATGTIDFSTTSNVALGAVANINITGGSAGYLLSTDGLGELSWIAPPSTQSITNGGSNVSIPSSGGNVNTSVGGTANVLVVTATGANISGTLNATGNANVGNIGATNGVFTNVSGNGSGLSSITGANVTGTVANATHATTANTVVDAAQPNITSVGTLTSVAVTGNATVGNVVLNGGIQSNRANVSVSTTATVIDQFAPATYRTAKYVISASSVDGYQSVETLLIHDGTTSYITVYGSICSNASVDIVEISSNLDGVSGNIRVYATSANATATVNLVATYLKT